MISRCSSPMPERRYSPDSLFMVNLRLGSSSVSFLMTLSNLGRSLTSVGSTATVTTGSET